MALLKARPTLGEAAKNPPVAGSADLHFAARDGRTRLVKSLARPPFVVQRALYLDSCLDDMAFLFLANPTAGIFQGDHQRISVSIGPDARAHITTQSATKIHAMPDSLATQETCLTVEDGAYLEYLPEPLIPFQGARFRQESQVMVAPGGSLLYGEVIAPGRLARGESLAYDWLESRLTVCGPPDVPVYHESYRLEPQSKSAQSRVALGLVDTPTLGTLLVVSGKVDANILVERLRETIRPEWEREHSMMVGVTALAWNTGVAVKVMGTETQPVKTALTELASVARESITGAPLPFVRRY